MKNRLLAALLVVYGCFLYACSVAPTTPREEVLTGDPTLSGQLVPNGTRVTFVIEPFPSDQSGLDFEIGLVEYATSASGISSTFTRSLTNNRVPDTDPAISPDGSRVAFVRWTGSLRDGFSSSQIFTVTADGNSFEQLTNLRGGVRRHPQFSFDGRRLLFANVTDGTLWTVNLDGSNLRQVFDRDSQPVVGRSACFGPDGTIYYEAVGATGGIEGLSPAGERLGLIVSDFASQPRVSHDGRRLLYQSFGRARVLDLGTRQLIPYGGEQDERESGAAFTSNPQVLIVSRQPSNERVPDLEARAAGTELPDERVPIRFLFTPFLNGVTAPHCSLPGVATQQVTPVEVASLVFSQQPSRSAPGRIIEPTVRVTALDAQGQPAFAAAGRVRLRLESNPGQAELTVRDMPLVNAVASFPTLALTAPGTGYTLVATYNDLESPPSVPFDVAVDPVPARLRFVTQPQDTAQGAMLPAIQVEVLDQFGTRMPTAGPAVSLAPGTAPAGAVLSGTSANVAPVNGVSSFTNLSLNVPGVYTLVASAPGLASDTSASFNITAVGAGSFAFVLNSTSADLAGFTRDAISGVLATLGAATPAGGAGPRRLVRTPDGRFLFTAIPGDDNVVSHTVDVATGALSNPQVTAVGDNPVEVALNPAGDRLYVVNQNANTFSGFSIGGTGALTPLPGSPYPAGGGLFADVRFTIHPMGQFAYCTTGVATLRQYNVLASGALAPMAPATSSPVVNSRKMVCHPNLSVAYVMASNQMAATAIDAGGDLVEPLNRVLNPILTNPGTPTDMLVTPDGNFLYVSDAFQGVFGWSLDGLGNGNLIAGAPFAAGTTASALAVDATSTFLYVTNRASNDVTVFRIGAGGALTPIAGSPFAVPGIAPDAITVNP